MSAAQETLNRNGGIASWEMLDDIYEQCVNQDELHYAENKDSDGFDTVRFPDGSELYCKFDYSHIHGSGDEPELVEVRSEANLLETDHGDPTSIKGQVTKGLNNIPVAFARAVLTQIIEERLSEMSMVSISVTSP